MRRARQEIDAEEFVYWMAYFRLETWDFEGYHQAAKIIAKVAIMLGNDKVTETDFMPLKDKPEKGMNIEAAQQTIAAMFGG